MNWDQVSWLWDWMPLLGDLLRKVWDYLVKSDEAATVILGLVGLGLLWWRSKSSERQAKAAQEQAEVAQAQIALAQLDSLYDRYQKGADMLGDASMATRLGGIYSLRRLAEEHPNQFHIQVIETLCAFLRQPPFPDSMPDKGAREDVLAALDSVVYRSDLGIEIEKATESDPHRQFQINLRGASLPGAQIPNAKLSSAELSRVTLDSANCTGADLSGVSLIGGSLVGAMFTGAKFDQARMAGINMSHSGCQQASFRGAELSSCNLSDSLCHDAVLTNADLAVVDITNAALHGVDLSGAVFRTGARTEVVERIAIPIETLFCQVTQRQLDTTIANPEDPPQFDETIPDIETGKPISWNDELCGNRWIEMQKNLNPEQDATSIGPQGLRALWPFRR